MNMSTTKTLTAALLAAIGLSSLALAETVSAPPPAAQITPTAADTNAPQPIMGMGKMGGMRNGMGPGGDGQVKACQQKHGPMGMMEHGNAQGQGKNCQKKCATMQGNDAMQQRIEALEKRVDLMQTMIEMMARK